VGGNRVPFTRLIRCCNNNVTRDKKDKKDKTEVLFCHICHICHISHVSHACDIGHAEALLPIYLRHEEFCGSTRRSRNRSPSESAMILLIGVDGTEMDVESIFALLLTRVTEPKRPNCRDTVKCRTPNPERSNRTTATRNCKKATFST